MLHCSISKDKDDKHEAKKEFLFIFMLPFYDYAYHKMKWLISGGKSDIQNNKRDRLD